MTSSAPRAFPRSNLPWVAGLGAAALVLAACSSSHRPAPRYVGSYPGQGPWTQQPPAWAPAPQPYPMTPAPQPTFAPPPAASSAPPSVGSAAPVASSATPGTPPPPSTGPDAPPDTSVAWVDIRSSAITGGAMPNLMTDMTAMLPSFRSCYLSGLRTEPKMGGSLEIVANIATDGHVSDAHVENVKGIAPAVASCVIEYVAEHPFAHPSREASVIRVPVTFVPQNGNAPKKPTGATTDVAPPHGALDRGADVKAAPPAQRTAG
jgi:hypothetical protein